MLALENTSIVQSLSLLLGKETLTTNTFSFLLFTAVITRGNQLTGKSEVGKFYHF